MASNMMSIDDKEEVTSDVDAISLDSEYYDALEEDEDSRILSDKDVHTPEAVYKQIQQITFDKSPAAQFRDKTYTKDSSVFSFDSMEQALPKKRRPILKNEFSRLLNNLSLTKFHPSKITLQDVRSIKSQDLPITERSIPWLMLSKIIMLNFKAREEDLSLFYEKNAEEPVPQPYDSEDDLFEEDEVSPQINPMDMFYVTFLSCDMMLKQEIVSKLFACRLAVPILFRDIDCKLVLTKWGLRKILLNKQIANKSIQMDAIHCKRLSIGASKRRVACGFVEASWFVSSGLGDEFGEHIMFMNLRGESIEYREEVEILCKLTNLLIVHTDILQLNNPKVREMLRTIHQNKVQVLYALESNDNPSVQPNKIYRDYRNHVAEFKSSIRFFDLKSVQQARSVRYYKGS
ncbi:unnamed protein product [Mytilus edulis]|uniref:Up-regulator of cell proliferation-like domain-containing protein n=1 Tax=Mytilus edulis TaxID=6550 RepID=A0A8S3VB54_MYTED|nr:unnamed protein product [Mytilus edulis]